MADFGLSYYKKVVKLEHGVAHRPPAPGVAGLQWWRRRRQQAAMVLQRLLVRGRVDPVALGRVIQSLVAAEGPRQMAATLAGAIASHLGLGAAVALAPAGEAAPRTLRVEAAAGSGWSGLEGCTASVAPGPLAEAWRSQEPIQTRVRHLSSAELADRLAVAGVGRLWLIPMVGRAAPQGLLLLPAASPRALALAQLLAAQAGLAAASLSATAALRELAAAGAHEVRNGLTELRGLVQLAAVAPERAAPRLAEALAAADRVTRLTTDLLTLSRPLWLHPVPLDLAALTDAVLAAAPAGGVAVERQYDPAGPVVAADPERLRQVIRNLLDNALAAMGGRGTLRLSTGVEAGEAWLAVADSGPGIAPEQVPQLFTPFFSLRPEGSGLGLVICQRLAEAHGGRIEVCSTPGEGAAFTLRLPLRQGTHRRGSE